MKTFLPYNSYILSLKVFKTPIFLGKRILFFSYFFFFFFIITKTYPYNFDPIKPQFNIVKLGFTGVYSIFLISAQNIFYFLVVKFSVYLNRRVFVMVYRFFASIVICVLSLFVPNFFYFLVLGKPCLVITKTRLF